MLVFLPSSRAAASRLRAAGEDAATRPGYAATGELRAAHGLGAGEGEGEDAEYLALSHAGAAARGTDDEPGLVLAVDVPLERVLPGPQADLGEVWVRELRWSEVIALFVLEEADPLWYDPSELDHLS